MELTENARKFLVQEILSGQEGDPDRLTTALFDWISRVVAEKDQQIEPKSDAERMQRRFRALLREKRFFPSFEWLKYFGQGKGLLSDTPLDYLGGGKVRRSSLSESDVLTCLDKDDPYLIDVPSNFIKVLDQKKNWPISYRHEPFSNGEVPSSQLWEAISEQIRRIGYPVMHFPEAQRTETQLANPPGRMVRGVLNLSQMVGVRDGRPYLDWNKIVDTVVQGVRMLDALVEVAEEQTGDGYIRTVRRIGIGLMGWGEMLLKLETPYQSEEALDLARRLMKFIQAAVQEATAALVRYRPAVEGAFVRIRGYEEPVRNLSRLYILPEPELAFLAGTTPGLEPLPGLAGRYQGFVEGEAPMFFHPHLMEYLEERHLMNEQVMDQLLDEGLFHEEMDLPEEVLELFKVRSQISPFTMLEHQLAFQGFCEDLVVQRIWADHRLDDETVRRCFNTAVRRRARSLWIHPLKIQSGPHFSLGASN